MDVVDSDSDLNCTPEFLAEQAKQVQVSLNLLPAKSKLKYEQQYSNFIKWCDSKHIRTYSESATLAYFTEQATIFKSSTLWSKYSMLRAVLHVRNDIDLSTHRTLIAFLKQKAVGYKANKSKTFTMSEVETFLKEAPNETHLLRKVALVLGIAGACRRDELVKMTIDDIQDKETMLLVSIPDSKTNEPREFRITTHNHDPNAMDYLEIIRKYLALRPVNAETRRLFLRYRNGKCFNQVVGVNLIGKMPSEIAAFLKLPACQLYTGHCFRRTSTTLLISGVADSYIDRMNQIGKIPSQIASFLKLPDTPLYTGHSFRRTSSTILASGHGGDLVERPNHSDCKSSAEAQALRTKYEALKQELHKKGADQAKNPYISEESGQSYESNDTVYEEKPLPPLVPFSSVDNNDSRNDEEDKEEEYTGISNEVVTVKEECADESTCEQIWMENNINAEIAEPHVEPMEVNENHWEETRVTRSKRQKDTLILPPTNGCGTSEDEDLRMKEHHLKIELLTAQLNARKRQSAMLEEEHRLKMRLLRMEMLEKKLRLKKYSLRR